jgi:hypothetical protein
MPTLREAGGEPSPAPVKRGVRIGQVEEGNGLQRTRARHRLSC